MKRLKVISVLLVCLMLTGCWDAVDIDRRVFVSTIGIDPAKDIDKDKEMQEAKDEDIFAQKNIKKINVSYAFPDVSDFSPNKPIIKGDNVFSVETYSMEGAFMEATGKSSRDIYIEHARLIMLNRDILKHPNTVKEVMDYLQRQAKINRRAYVVMTEDPAEEFVKFKAPIDKHIQTYITGIMENARRNGFVLPITLTEFLSQLDENGNAIIPVLKLEKNKSEITLAGTGIIKDYEFKGKLDPTETQDLEILRGKIKSGVKVVYNEGHPIDFEINGITRKIKAKREENKLIFDIDINLEGRLAGAYVGKNQSSKDNIENLQNKFNKSIAQELDKTVQYLQAEPKVDPIGLNNYLQKFKPDIWKEVKDNWEEEFCNAKINVRVNTFIRRTGISN